jgi:hypothetical protein
MSAHAPQGKKGRATSPEMVRTMGCLAGNANHHQLNNQKLIRHKTLLNLGVPLRPCQPLSWLRAGKYVKKRDYYFYA